MDTTSPSGVYYKTHAYMTKRTLSHKFDCKYVSYTPDDIRQFDNIKVSYVEDNIKIIDVKDNFKTIKQNYFHVEPLSQNDFLINSNFENVLGTQFFPFNVGHNTQIGIDVGPKMRNYDKPFGFSRYPNLDRRYWYDDRIVYSVLKVEFLDAFKDSDSVHEYYKKTGMDAKTELSKILISISIDILIDCVKRVISLGADINFIDKEGYTPLVMAMATSSYEVAEFLVKEGADCSFSGCSFNIPFIDAICSKKVELVKLMLENSKVDLINSITTKLNRSSFYYKSIYDPFINLPTELTNEYKKFPLHIAAQYGSLEIVKILLEYGAKILERDQNGKLASDLAKDTNIKEYLQNYQELPPF